MISICSSYGFGLGPLRDVDDIFDRQRMQREDLADLANQFLVTESLHVHPRSPYPDYVPARSVSGSVTSSSVTSFGVKCMT